MRPLPFRASAAGHLPLFPFILGCIFLLYASLALGGSSPPPAFSVATRSFGVWDKNSGERVDFSVWYPGRAAPREKVQDGWLLDVSRPGRVIPGFYPVVLISHDTASSRFANNDLAVALAEAGMIVIAPTHTGDNQSNTSQLHSVALLRDRPRHLLRALETVLASPDFAPYTDESRIGLLGVGMGSITVMQLAGAEPDFSLLAGYCDFMSDPDAFCAPWTAKRLGAMPAIMQSMEKTQGTDIFNPSLALYAPELVSVPVPAAHALAQPRHVHKPRTLWQRLFGAKEEYEEEHGASERDAPLTPQPAQAVSEPGLRGPEREETGGSGSFPLRLDFQGGPLFGGTDSGSPFVYIALPESPQFRLTVPDDHSAALASPDLEPVKIDSSRAFRRLPEERRILCLALLSPAGGMLFTRESLASIQLPVALVEAGKNRLYPVQQHSQPYFAQLPVQPMVLSFEDSDHFSLFARCSRDTMTNLGEVCGRLVGDERKKIAEGRDRFLVPFFQSVLGGPTDPPPPSGFVAVEADE
ncbi:hypothetical protein LJC59_04825 [Desulfovibrio sp. OttesenSCG-928-A18]|nr:hypothetical protein [Desulfovibrio sp. OttesenSCG-928-A18]